MTNLSIIIPSRNRSNLERCVRAIREAGEACRIIVVDDGLDGWQFRKEDEPLSMLLGAKPFIFARNVNIGMRRSAADVVVLNDDALLDTPGGFTMLQKATEEHPEYGVIAATTNNVGNRSQLPQSIGLREDPRMVCFVAVLIPRHTIDAVGLLDEEFSGYGFEDDSYCLRVRRAGLKIGIHDGCFVDHRHLPSTFRSGAYPTEMFERNRLIFRRKYGADNHEL